MTFAAQRESHRFTQRVFILDDGNQRRERLGHVETLAQRPATRHAFLPPQLAITHHHGAITVPLVHDSMSSAVGGRQSAVGY
jgi:hypothetical protein